MTYQINDRVRVVENRFEERDGIPVGSLGTVVVAGNGGYWVKMDDSFPVLNETDKLLATMLRSMNGLDPEGNYFPFESHEVERVDVADAS